MVTMGVFPFQGKTHIVEPGIEPGTTKPRGWSRYKSCSYNKMACNVKAGWKTGVQTANSRDLCDFRVADVCEVYQKG